MNGRIWIETELNKGSTFFITIPCKKSGKTEKNDPQEENLSAKWDNKTVLIVEDDYTSFIYLQTALSITGINIIHAKNGEEAIEMFKNKQVDLVLMDIQLPQMDGITVTKKIKEIKKNIPVIAQTAHAMVEDRSKVIQAGCDDYLSKPINRAELFVKMARFLH
jgi:hypothetical protein